VSTGQNKQGELGDFVSPAATRSPYFISPLSAWNEHVPFAGWVVEAAQPRRIVELGVHIGVSYFAFCEAVRDFGLSTECFAVDHWLGDRHSGEYGEDVFKSVNDLNNERYLTFSTLLRKSFDDALEEFQSGAVDLLHIDGLHTYEAVKNDFEKWLPKMSRRGVVLLHDTAERKGDFGVYRLMNELRQQYSVFEFAHGHGLGVVAVGPSAPEAIARLTSLESEDPPLAYAVREMYQRLGARLSTQLDLERLTSDITDRKTKLSALNRHLGDLHRTLFGRDPEQGADEYSGAIETVTRLKNEVQRLTRLTEETTSRNTELHADLDIARQELELTSRQRHAAASGRRRAELRADQLQHGLTEREFELEGVRTAHETLLRRRAVRFALSIAALFRPGFRIVRRIRARVRQSSHATIEPVEQIIGPANPPLIDPEFDMEGLATRLRAAPQVTVVIPVHNAPVELERCLASVVRNTTCAADILVIDDASTDPAVTDMLDRYATFDGVRLLRNRNNLGFVRTVNRGFQETSGDVVVLNSDTQVTHRWVENLRLAAYLDDRVASSTPLSNDAGAFSAPQIGTANPVPTAGTAEDLGRMVARTSLRCFPDTPTGNGFCMYIKRAALDEVGLFDAQTFPRGYGEENDWSMRALAAGWRHLVDDATYILHSKGSSFGSDREPLLAQARQRVNELHPTYTSRVQEFVSSTKLVAAQAAVGEAFRRLESEPGAIKPRLLSVLHEGTGGTPATNLDLMIGIQDSFETLLLTCDTGHVRLHFLDGKDLVELESLALEPPIRLIEESRADYRAFVTSVLTRYAVELVHIRHLIRHTSDVPYVASALGIPVILSFHDYFFSCPTVHLLDERNEFCGGLCTPGEGSCRVPTPWLGDVPHLKHRFVHTWRERGRRIFGGVDAFVTTSLRAKEVYVRSYPELAERKFEVIEHGRDLIQRRLATPPQLGDRVRVLVPGNLEVHKGADLIHGIQKADIDGRIEFHFAGSGEDEYRDLGIWHGTYEREKFPELVEEIRPHLIGLFSIWGETYSHTLTEAWSVGVPVVATDIGAFSERVGKHGGGWLIDPVNPEKAVSTILSIADDPEEYTRRAAQADLVNVRSVREMGLDYAHLYSSALADRRTAADSNPSSPMRRHVLRVGLFVTGSNGKYPGSVHVRTLARFGHPSARQSVVSQICDPQAFVDGAGPGFDVCLVQRTALPPDMTEAFLAECEHRGTPVVFDLDDNLLDNVSGADSEYRPHAESLRLLCKNAALITVSTEPLAELVTDLNPRVAVVPNALDERLWFRHPPHIGESGGPKRLVYIGTTTHGEDLRLLRSAFEELRHSGLEVELVVVGGEPPDKAQGWYTPLPIPDSHYPEFVPWLYSQRHNWLGAVAPLAETQFNRYKSDLKFLEYSALGLAGVYSGRIPYANSVEHMRTGLLTNDDPISWAHQIETLVTDTHLRNTIQQNAYSEVVANRGLGKQAQSILELLFQIV
jgi:O-antigen biosynthesis protein